MLNQRFEGLCAVLEERKGELLQALAKEQEEKLQRVRGLIRQYGDHLEASSKLVESAIQSMEEPQMALYLQVGPGGRGRRAVAGHLVAAVGAFALGSRVQVLFLAPTCPMALGKSPSLPFFFSLTNWDMHPPPNPQDSGGHQKWDIAGGWHSAYSHPPFFPAAGQGVDQ